MPRDIPLPTGLKPPSRRAQLGELGHFGHQAVEAVAQAGENGLAADPLVGGLLFHQGSWGERRLEAGALGGIVAESEGAWAVWGLVARAYARLRCGCRSDATRDPPPRSRGDLPLLAAYKLITGSRFTALTRIL